ncbi:unnamed protein product [Laminaria digitata]
MTLLKRAILPALVAVMMIGGSVAVHAQVAKMADGLTQFSAASKELISLYSASKDAKSATAAANKIAAATKRKDAAEAAIGKALQKIDPKNEKAGKMAEKIFTGLQTYNKAIAEAKLASIERVAAATAKMKADPQKKN